MTPLCGRACRLAYLGRLQACCTCAWSCRRELRGLSVCPSGLGLSIFELLSADLLTGHTSLLSVVTECCAQAHFPERLGARTRRRQRRGHSSQRDHTLPRQPQQSAMQPSSRLGGCDLWPWLPDGAACAGLQHALQRDVPGADRGVHLPGGHLVLRGAAGQGQQKTEARLRYVSAALKATARCSSLGPATAPALGRCLQSFAASYVGRCAHMGLTSLRTLPPRPASWAYCLAQWQRSLSF